jgi:hypothetical protein
MAIAPAAPCETRRIDHFELSDEDGVFPQFAPLR